MKISDENERILPSDTSLVLFHYWHRSFRKCKEKPTAEKILPHAYFFPPILLSIYSEG